MSFKHDFLNIVSEEYRQEALYEKGFKCRTREEENEKLIEIVENDLAMLDYWFWEACSCSEIPEVVAAAGCKAPCKEKKSGDGSGCFDCKDLCFNLWKEAETEDTIDQGTPQSIIKQFVLSNFTLNDIIMYKEQGNSLEVKFRNGGSVIIK